MRYATRLLCQLVFVAVNAGLALAQTPVHDYEIVAQYPHDTAAFTEGLELVDGTLYESTGLNGASELRQVDLTSGIVLRRVPLADQYFGEGMTLFRGKLFVLTYLSQTGLIYDPATFTQVGTFSYSGEGWGLTHDDQHLIMSNGTNQIRFIDPSTLQSVRTINVRDSQGNPVPYLNELEYINGEIYANVWPTAMVARISPVSGQLLGLIDFSALWPVGIYVDVLNGIAFDKTTGHLLLTGKYWPTLYEVRLNGDGSAPVAKSQTVSTAEDTPQNITLSATDVDGDALTFTVTSSPAHGVLSGTAPFLIYTPSPNYYGTDTFTYAASDGTYSSNVATVTVTIAAVNDAPISVNDSYATSVQTPLAVAARGVLTNDADVDSATLTAMVVAGPSHGSLTLAANGSFTYTPATAFVGTDAFTYVAHDGISSSNVATAVITVSGPAVSVSPNTLNFGTLALGSASATQLVTITNRGGAAIAISSIRVTGSHPADFLQTNNCGGALAASASCQISVAFKPTKVGSRKASLAITTNAGSTASVVTLTGTGKKR